LLQSRNKRRIRWGHPRRG